jgi:hypothetical protein
MTMTADSDRMENTPPKSLKRFMSQSTIYKRNEARLATTYALKDDTRPAAARVLSALSLSRSASPVSQTSRHIVQVQPGFSQETMFCTSTDLLAITSTRLNPSPVSGVFLCTSFGGAASQFVFGARNAGSMSLQHNESKIAQIAFEGHANAASVTLPGQKQMAVSKISHSQVAASAAISGILFGSKAAFSRALCDDRNAPLSLPSMASSALAGASKATLTVPLQTIRSFQFMASRPLNFADAVSSIIRSQGIQGLYHGSRNVFSGEMIGAIAYFSTYEAVKTYLSPKNEENPVSSFAIGVSGALAGVVYQTALQEFARCHRPINLQSFLGAQQRVYFPSLARTMPIHATLFLCYESAVLAAQI